MRLQLATRTAQPLLDAARMKTLLTLILLSSIANAEPAPTAYVQGDAMLGAPPVGIIAATLGVEGGYRLASGPVWAHAAVAAGNIGDDGGSGSLVHVRGGAEAWSCWTSWLCGAVGADLGVEHAHVTFESMTSTMTALTATPRLVIDAGSGIRARLALEPSFKLAGYAHGPEAHPSRTFVGGNLVAGVAYQW